MPSVCLLQKHYGYRPPPLTRKLRRPLLTWSGTIHSAFALVIELSLQVVDMACFSLGGGKLRARPAPPDSTRTLNHFLDDLEDVASKTTRRRRLLTYRPLRRVRISQQNGIEVGLTACENVAKSRNLVLGCQHPIGLLGQEILGQQVDKRSVEKQTRGADSS